MTNEELAQRYADRLIKCLTAIKIFVIGAIAAVAALIIFAMIAIGVNMQESNPSGLLLGVIILGTLAVACVLGAMSTLVAAKITVTKLKKLDTAKS